MTTTPHESSSDPNFVAKGDSDEPSMMTESDPRTEQAKDGAGSDDAKAAKQLVETLKDGERGFADAAEKLRDSDRPEWGTTLQRLSEQRAGFHREIVAMGHEYGEDVDESGTVAAALHRGWMSLKDALSGDDAGRVLGAAVTGENHAVSEYEEALQGDLSSGFREVVSRQHAAVVAARDEVKALQIAD